MSTKYKKGAEVPTSVLCARLKKLSDDITNQKFTDFSMSVPVQFDRDADMVLHEAARRLERLLVITTNNTEGVDE